jgi:hypothetical protein
LKTPSQYSRGKGTARCSSHTTAALPEKFRDFGKDGKVFAINTDTKTQTVAPLLYGIAKIQDVERNKNDALHIDAILLDSRYQATVKVIMLNSNDQIQQDQVLSCPLKAFYQQASANIGSISYMANSPALAHHIIGHEEMDPNVWKVCNTN